MSRTFELAKTPRTLTIDASTGIPSFDGASIIMNADEAGTPSETVAFEVERGTSNNVSIRWNETSDVWELTTDGVSFSTIESTGNIALGTDTTGDYVQNLVAGALIDLQNNSGEGATPTVDVNLSELTDMTETAVGTDEMVILDASQQKRKALNEIQIGLFDTADQIALSTDTTGNYVQQGATSGNGLSGSVNSEGGTFTVTSNATDANTASTIVFRDASGNFSAGEITATKIFTPTIDTTDSSAITITPPVNFNADVTAENDLQVNNHAVITRDLTVGGNLTVQGTTTQVDSNVVNIGDNIITLNADEAGTPSQNAGIEVERGTSTNVQFRWNETTDKWELTEDGAAYSNVLTTADEGTGNGLDADTVDGLEAESFIRSDATDSATGAITFSNATASTNSTTGAVIVTGGVGIGGALNVAGQITGATTDTLLIKNSAGTTLKTIRGV